MNLYHLSSGHVITDGLLLFLAFANIFLLIRRIVAYVVYNFTSSLWLQNVHDDEYGLNALLHSIAFWSFMAFFSLYFAYKVPLWVYSEYPLVNATVTYSTLRLSYLIIRRVVVFVLFHFPPTQDMVFDEYDRTEAFRKQVTSAFIWLMLSVCLEIAALLASH